MIDEYVKKYSEMFEKYGDPRKNKDKYSPWNYDLECKLYIAYTSGILRQTIAISGLVPKIKIKYEGSIDELIKEIKDKNNQESIDVIYVTNEINNIDDLNKLKESFPTKEIIIYWNNEFATVDDVISSRYMIDYYKSLIEDDMTPLEKVTMIYDIIKSHYYKDYEIKRTMYSRHISLMVNNDYIVCVGYVKLFNRVLSELGFKTLYLSSNLKDGDNILGHERSIVEICDLEYGINDGFFVFDPTFDASNHKHYYVFNGKKASYSNMAKEGYEEADSLCSYRNFLISLNEYESKYKNSFNETIRFKSPSSSSSLEIDSKKTHEFLHENQIQNTEPILSLKDFMRLLYKVRSTEGYDFDQMPKIFQETFYINGYGYFDKQDIENYFKTEFQESKVVNQ